MAVYMIRAGVIGPVKIGFGGDVSNRLRSIVPPKPCWTWIMRVFEGARTEEAALHRRFAACREQGEWFTFDPDMMGDVGLRELAVPRVKRNGYRLERPDSARRIRDFFHQDILGLVGGSERIAESVGVATGSVMSLRNIQAEFYSAAVVLARQAGRHDITLRTFEAIDEAFAREIEATKQEVAAKEAAKVPKFDPLVPARTWLAENGVAPIAPLPEVPWHLRKSAA